MEEKKVPPYRTSSGLEIGKFYVPQDKKQDQSFDSQLLQTALLETKKEIKTNTAIGYYLVFMAVLIVIELFFVITK
jgi:hypothetical protein